MIEKETSVATDEPRPRRVLCIASAGGHWVELMRLVPHLAVDDIVFASVRADYYAKSVPGREFHVVRDATRWNPFAMAFLICQIAVLLVRVRPDAIVTTGAAPGLWAAVVGRIFRRKTIWIDSIANADELSMSGRLARRFASLWLTQWPDLAEPDGPEYAGTVA